jgi:molecular chaperone DnaK
MSDEQESLKDKLIIGIDLGTTKSVVSVWSAEQGSVVILPDDEGYEVTPSVVGWDRMHGAWLVGHAAKDLALHNPSDVVYSIKRYIGRWFNDRAVLYGRQDLTYNLVSGGGTDPLRDVLVDFGVSDDRPLQLTAPEISSQVLYKLRQNAARALELPLDALKYAVITVPAYFNVLQRRATIEAGRLAGLEVVDILNEPTAAALAYSSYAPDLLGPEEKRILVFDLGGGTFDISLLEAERDEIGYVFYTRVVDGDTRLGGDDIDISVARWLANQIEKQHGYPVRADDYLTRVRLRQKAEEAKIALTTQDVVTIDLPALDLGSRSPFDVHVKFDRDQLERCAADVLERTRAITKRAVQDVAELAWDQIDEIILVGGQTLMPAVQREVEMLTKHKPRVLEKPHLAVALGAGEYAHILSLGKERFEENALINVIALPLGIREDDNTFKRLVDANVTVPHTSKPYYATTTVDNQTLISVEVLQGPRDAKVAEQCISLGQIDMEVPPAPAHTPKFEVVFDVKSDGTMRVIVTDTRRKRPPEILDIMETKALAWRDQAQETEVTNGAS